MATPDDQLNAQKADTAAMRTALNAAVAAFNSAVNTLTTRLADIDAQAVALKAAWPTPPPTPTPAPSDLVSAILSMSNPATPNEGALPSPMNGWSWGQHGEIGLLAPPSGWHNLVEWIDVFWDASGPWAGNLRLRFSNFRTLILNGDNTWSVAVRASTGACWCAELGPDGYIQVAAPGYRQENVGWSWLYRPHYGFHATPPGGHPVYPAGAKGVLVAVDIGSMADDSSKPTTGSLLVRCGFDWRSNGSNDLAINPQFLRAPAPGQPMRTIGGTTIPAATLLAAPTPPL